MSDEDESDGDGSLEKLRSQSDRQNRTANATVSREKQILCKKQIIGKEQILELACRTTCWSPRGDTGTTSTSEAWGGVSPVQRLSLQTAKNQGIAAMRVQTLLCAAVVLLAVVTVHGSTEEKKKKKLQIGVKKRVPAEKCKIKSRKGDTLQMHYTGTLEDKTQFDSSIPRGDPFVFTLGAGQVIKGWDQGLLGMCEGEKRKLVIPSDLGYGDRGSPPKIPGGATLIFEVELIKIDRKEEL